MAHCVTARWRNFSHYCRPLRQYDVWLRVLIIEKHWRPRRQHTVYRNKRLEFATEQVGKPRYVTAVDGGLKRFPWVAWFAHPWYSQRVRSQCNTTRITSASSLAGETPNQGHPTAHRIYSVQDYLHKLYTTHESRSWEIISVQPFSPSPTSHTISGGNLYLLSGWTCTGILLLRLIRTYKQRSLRPASLGWVKYIVHCIPVYAQCRSGRITIVSIGWISNPSFTKTCIISK